MLQKLPWNNFSYRNAFPTPQYNAWKARVTSVIRHVSHHSATSRRQYSPTVTWPSLCPRQNLASHFPQNQTNSHHLSLSLSLSTYAYIHILMHYLLRPKVILCLLVTKTLDNPLSLSHTHSNEFRYFGCSRPRRPTRGHAGELIARFLYMPISDFVRCCKIRVSIWCSLTWIGDFFVAIVFFW